MSQTTEELKAEIKKTMGLIQTLRDEARVKMHLAALDVKDAWDKLEPKLEEAERIAADASEATLATLKSTAHRVERLVGSL